MIRFLTAAVLVLSASVAMAQEGTKTWEGTWNNKKYNSKGTLKCVAKLGKDGKWTATFTGVFMAEKFTYDVTFDEKKGKAQSDLTGKATIRNQNYDWTGSIKGDTLTGSYKSNGGYFGDFVLKEAKAK